MSKESADAWYEIEGITCYDSKTYEDINPYCVKTASPSPNPTEPTPVPQLTAAPNSYENCVIPEDGGWLYDGVIAAQDQSRVAGFCVVSTSIDRVSEYVTYTDRKNYGTCVVYSEDSTFDCEPTDLICGGGKTYGWKSQQSATLSVAMRRNDFKHPNCPSIQDVCAPLSDWYQVSLQTAGISQHDIDNVCYGADGMVRFVEQDHYIETCVGFDTDATKLCDDTKFVCSGTEEGQSTFGYPSPIISNIAEALGESNRVHANCPN